MSKVRLRCQLGGECGYETVPLEYAQANQQVESHMRWAHSAHSSNPGHAPLALNWREFSEFLGVTWSEGETASQFASRLRAVAANCDFSVKCPSCRTEVSYSDSLVIQKLVANLSLREQQGKENTDTLSSDGQEELVGQNGEPDGEKEEALEEAPAEAQKEAPKEAKDQAFLDNDMQELRILNIETVTPVPARKRHRIACKSSKYTTEQKGKKETTFTCVKCGKYYYSRAKLRGHYSLTHYKAKLKRLIKEDNQCPECQKSFTKLNTAIRHLGTVHNKIEKYLTHEKNAQRKTKAQHIGAAQNIVGKDSNTILVSVFLVKSAFF